MMTVAAAVTGLVVLAAVSTDVMATTLAAGSGSGRLTGWLGRRVARLVLVGCGDPTSWRRHVVGPAVLVSTVTCWIVGLTVAWTMLLAPAPMVDAATNLEVGFWERVAFTLSTLSSLGPGYVRPGSAFASLAASVMSMSGLGLITLSITYVLPVVTAVTERRVQATAISTHGLDAASIADTLGEDPDEARHLVRGVAGEVRLLTQRHLAYPVLHHFHATDRRAAYAPNLAAFDAAVALLEGRGRVSPLLASTLHAAVDGLLEAASPHLRDVDEHACPATRRRHLLDAFVRDAGWPLDPTRAG